MPLQSIGDLSFSFQSMRQTTRLKSQLQDLSLAMSTGEKGDLTRALGPNQRLLTQLDQDLVRLDGFDRTVSFVGQRMTVLQAAVGGIETLRQTLIDRTLLPSSDLTQLDLTTAADEARAVFGSLVSTLNSQAAGRSLFAGQATDRAALQPADAMMAALEALVAGAATAVELTQRVTDWFDDPAGGFATTGYTGGTGAATDANVSETRQLTLEVTAADPALRDMLKLAAIAALTTDAGAGLTLQEQKDAMGGASLGAINATVDLVNLQARIGDAQARIAEARAENAAARTSFSIARNELAAADPYETASALQQVQQSLELHFAATARLSRLSLANYL